MRKHTELFLTRRDEESFSKLLKNEFPSIKFLDDRFHPDEPIFRDCLEDCTSNQVFFLASELDLLHTSDGKVVRVESGYFVQFLRSIVKEDALLPGRLVISADDNPQIDVFTSAVWKCVRKIGRIGVKTLDGNIDRHFLVGANAREKSLDGSLILKDRAGFILFEPIL